MPYPTIQQGAPSTSNGGWWLISPGAIFVGFSLHCCSALILKLVKLFYPLDFNIYILVTRQNIMFKTTTNEYFESVICEMCMQNKSTIEAVSTDNKLIYICNNC